MDFSSVPATQGTLSFPLELGQVQYGCTLLTSVRGRLIHRRLHRRCRRLTEIICPRVGAGSVLINWSEAEKPANFGLP